MPCSCATERRLADWISDTWSGQHPSLGRRGSGRRPWKACHRRKRLVQCIRRNESTAKGLDMRKHVSPEGRFDSHVLRALAAFVSDALSRRRLVDSFFRRAGVKSRGTGPDARPTSSRLRQTMPRRPKAPLEDRPDESGPRLPPMSPHLEAREPTDLEGMPGIQQEDRAEHRGGTRPTTGSDQFSHSPSPGRNPRNAAFRRATAGREQELAEAGDAVCTNSRHRRSPRFRSLRNITVDALKRRP